MEFKIDRDVFLKSLAHVQGVVEKKNTLPILGNVLLEAYDGFLKITATDLDIIITEKLTCQTIKEHRFVYQVLSEKVLDVVDASEYRDT